MAKGAAAADRFASKSDGGSGLRKVREAGLELASGLVESLGRYPFKLHTCTVRLLGRLQWLHSVMGVYSILRTAKEGEIAFDRTMSEGDMWNSSAMVGE